MTRKNYYLINLLAISTFVHIPGARTETSVNFLTSDTAIDILKDEGTLKDLNNKATLQEATCNDSHPCLNAGTCYGGACRCPKDYTGSRCETPAWCTWGRCGYGSDVECVWNRSLQEGQCHCKKDNYHYLPKDRKCKECDCGGHGSCQVVDDMLVCKCDDMYALKSAKCEPCDCGPGSERCSFSPNGDKVCQCPKGYASKTASWVYYGTWCEICDCGEYGRCSWDGKEKICDCETGFKLFGGKCRDCICGEHGTCKLDESGGKVCSCDYGYAERDGFCFPCDCNYLSSRRTPGVNCTFVDGVKHCICPPGFETESQFCVDINECFANHQPCPTNSICINKPGTFECKCRTGFKPIHSSSDPKLSGCEDIDECSEYPCISAATQCMNSPGSFDCVCRDGYYATSGTYGYSYNPAYNACYEIETQWREATIALGVILSVGIMGISGYIMKHRSSS